ncbi:acyltransferase family protein [Falsiroseomonas sp. CW058]|uniref:acyltransferase family protein n=1 Tax=Falsiroseomonas sp. CW058 TaxID=3388664 RepID=UPI003D3235B3
MGAMQGVGRAVSAKPERLATLTRLRLLLIIWVLVYHLELTLHALRSLPVADVIVMRGYLGVDGFFVLSGFALFLGYRHRPPLGLAGWADFVRRRAERVFPLHLAMLLALALLVGLAVLLDLRINEPQRFGAWEFAMQAALLHAWETTGIHAWNYPSWALSAVWAGYLVFPLLLVPAIGLRPAGAVLVSVLCLCALALLGELRPRTQLNWTLHLGLVRFGLEFLLGIALARLVTLRMVDAGLATASAAVLVPVGLALGVDVVVVAGLAALVCRLGMEVPGRGPPRDLAWTLGEASFGIYLSWVFVEAALVLLLRATPVEPAERIALMAAGLGASLVLGWFAWRLVELPAARFFGRRSGGVP